LTSNAPDLPGAELPAMGPDAGAALKPLRMLSLTGGGYRGLFSANVLVHLCALAGVKGDLETRFEIFAGTSIGALMACALAVGVAPQRVLDAIDANGPGIFDPKPLSKLRQLTTGAIYDSDRLSDAIKEALGAHASRRIADVEAALIVPAVDWSTGEAVIFMSDRLGTAHSSNATLHDVCMSSAAAPTFFAPYVLDGSPMLDGGLVANNPDMVALHEVHRRWPHASDRIEVLSIGTAGAGSLRPPDGAAKGGLEWARKLALFMIDVQEATAVTQARRFLGDRYLRVNYDASAGGPAFERLDLANDQARTALLQAGRETAQQAYSKHRAFIDRMLSGLRGS
jgi:predicted acylesterase/phospholipase RssA